uniref:Zinc finger, CCHC-type n=1 Tax=Tanacetum cinerariifolium TaxID=118510 RepID=A0A699H8T4_TANCI|nr:hypothetical protein [Tanacetum cinerariifolium]
MKRRVEERKVETKEIVFEEIPEEKNAWMVRAVVRIKRDREDHDAVVKEKEEIYSFRNIIINMLSFRMILMGFSVVIILHRLMSTPSANNSVFMGFFEKQKLTGPNFIDWYRQLRILLSIDDKLNYLEQQIPPAPLVPAGQHVTPEILAAHTAWIKGSKEIVRLMLMTMEPEIQQNLKNLHAHEMLLELKTLFALQAEQKLLQTTMGKTINELHAMLKLHEQTLPKNNALTLHAIRAGKVQKVNKTLEEELSSLFSRVAEEEKNAASGAGGSGFKGE